MAKTTKTTWILKINGATDNLGIFKTKEEGIDAAFKLISDHFTSIPKIVDGVLKQSHTKACRKLIENFKDVSNLRTSDVYEAFYNYSGNEVERIEENSFSAEMLLGATAIFSFSFGEKLFIETNIWDEEARRHFLYVMTESNSVKYNLYEETTISTSANIFLVYRALSTTPQLRKEIQSNIFNKLKFDDYEYEKPEYKLSLSEDTISNQIDALQKLGFPIYNRRLNNKDRKDQDVLIHLYGDQYKEGFYLDYDRPIAPDYSKLNPGSYLMLVYLTLREIDMAHALTTQQDIIDAVKNKFGITLQRQKVKNYLDILIELDSGIKHDKSGYWMK